MGPFINASLFFGQRLNQILNVEDVEHLLANGELVGADLGAAEVRAVVFQTVLVLGWLGLGNLGGRVHL